MSFSLPGLDPIDLAYQIGKADGHREGLDSLERIAAWARGDRLTRAHLVAWIGEEIEKYRANMPSVSVRPGSVDTVVVLLTDGARSVVRNSLPGDRGVAE
jgi:hypothetical protein